MLNMRPPLQTTALQQQNEGSRQQQQQQPTTKLGETPLHIQKQATQQQQQQIARKSSKLPHHDILVEKHLNSTHSKSTAIARKRSVSNTPLAPAVPAAAAATTTTTPAATTTTAPTTAIGTTSDLKQPSITYHAGSNLGLAQNAKQRPPPPPYRLNNHNSETPEGDIDDKRNDVNISVNSNDHDHDDDDSIQLVDLSTSPSSPSPSSSPSSKFSLPTTIRHASEHQEKLHAIATTTSIATATTAAAPAPPVAVAVAIASSQPPVHTQRSSISSNYQYSIRSTSASSDDDDDVSVKTFGEHQHLHPHPHQSYQQSSSRDSSFDDAAENFIINFPSADSSFLTQNQNDFIINLPLSETEPLLTNIEATVADKQRSICLNKNSASLIFIKKDLPNSNLAASSASASAANDRRNFFTPTNNNCNTIFKNPRQKHQQQQQQQQVFDKTGPKHSSDHSSGRRCHSLRIAASNEISNRRPTKHLPATYQHHNRHHHYNQQQQLQQQRRSLQLNYNNNLVTTSTCSANSNSNNNNCCPTALKGNGGAVLHRHHTNSNITLPATLATSALSRTNEARAAATATRKQHAYSWYAPVYSALEEELEQDSRDSSPIHNLANSKKHHSSIYQQRSNNKTSSTADNETVALLETRNKINIQAPQYAEGQHTKGSGSSSSSVNNGIHFNESLPTQHRKANASAHALSLQLTNSTGVLTSSTAGNQSTNNYEAEGPHAGSLGLAGGPLPRRRRLENLEKFFKSLVGIRPSSHGSGSGSGSGSGRSGGGGGGASGTTSRPDSMQNVSTQPMPLPSSPEIRITRTPSDQNMDMSTDAERRLLRTSTDKLTQPYQSAQSQGSTSSLNVVQQKLWNIMRREGSAASLHQEKSQSIVQYSGLRKCETVLALTNRHSNPPSYSPVYSGCSLSPDRCLAAQAPYMGSGVFSANGVEQIRPLNRLRNSATSINAPTCSRCSSLLSLAASGSRYSLNATTNAFINTIPGSVSSQQLQPPPSTFNCAAQQPANQRRYTAGMISNRRLSCGKRSRSSSASSSHEDTQNEYVDQSSSSSSGAAGTALQCKNSACSCTTSNSSVSCSRKSSAGAQSAITNTNSSSISPPSSNLRTATLNSSLTITTASSTNAATITTSQSATMDAATSAAIITSTPIITPTASTTPFNVKHSPSSAVAELLTASIVSSPTMAAAVTLSNGANQDVTDAGAARARASDSNITTETTTNALAASAASAAGPFEVFTCKLCLVDVETVKEATTLIQCGCHFCTECMKAYIDFEISEGAYDISCPDAQCPAQGVITLPEIAKLTTSNLMKKHHRYRLNREIELDKTRTWCPRAGCETVCRVGGGIGDVDADAAPSTSSAASATPTSSSLNGSGNENAAHSRCPVVCPSCKDEFCSSCKKTWHPNISCEENSRRLVADGQDDIGIPFDNDLIKCCPMCAVPIEKDEGCAQMMCKRCKHVFCWYCLASLDDDFLLRHYDKGPCKNKLGHSRASVVWHRAQVIGIFAGFGILLLVASPLLLLAAPCIICCKCRSCSGSKIDEGDTDLEEATALQS